MTGSKPAKPAGAILWMTGLSGSGKSTLAEALVARLTAEGAETEWLDGDRIRQKIGGVGFSLEDRTRHLQYMAIQAEALERRGVISICSFVSPLRENRDFARKLSSNFFEIFLATPITVCEQRDTKGLYARAKKGELTDLTGVGSLFEIPASPEITIDSSKQTVDESVEQVLSALKKAGVIG